MSALFEGTGLTNSQIAVALDKLKEQLNKIKNALCWVLPLLPDAEFNFEGYSMKIENHSITLRDYTLENQGGCVLEYTIKKPNPSSPTPP